MLLMPWRRRCIGAGAAADSLCCCWESALSAVLMPQLLCPFLCRLMRYTATQNRCKRVSCATRARFCNRTKPKHSPKPSRRHPSHAPSDSSVDDAKTLARRFGCCERVGVGFGTWTSSRVKPRRVRRKEGSAGAPTRGEEAGAARGHFFPLSPTNEHIEARARRAPSSCFQQQPERVNSTVVLASNRRCDR